MVLRQSGIPPMSPQKLLCSSALAEATFVSPPSMTTSASIDKIQCRQHHSLLHVVTDRDASSIRSSSGMAIPFARKRGSLLSQSNGTLSEDFVEETADGTPRTTKGDEAAANSTSISEPIIPRDPNSFVSRRVITRGDFPYSLQFPMLHRSATTGEPPENNGFVSSVRAPQSSSKPGSTSCPSIKDECIVTLLPQSGTKADNLISRTNEPLSGASSRVRSPSSHHCTSEDRLSATEFYPPDKPISQGMQPISSFLNYEEDQQSISHLTSTEAANAKSTERERRRGVIGSPRVVSRGERKGWKAKQREQPVNGINLKSDTPGVCTTARSDGIDSFRKNEKRRSNNVQVHPSCPATPHSVIEETTCEDDEGNLNNHVKTLQVNKVTDVPFFRGRKCSETRSPIYFTGGRRALQIVRRVVTERRKK
ncbi:hypothetical protein LSM04_002756 [Trypanosoma melophagium]|uniref:uncharacterized protein n=1 Tax=Trypanosoma melophagium TaxID=715481 RepID=UPI003519EA09|nr:hypothetical protein LSM04_002756 [Trypanosoma melophagium]